MTAGDAGGGFDELLSQMGKLQQHLSAAEQSVGREVVEGSAGGGAVVVRASGELSFDAVQIDPAVVEAGDVSVLEDLVLAAVRDAVGKLQALRQEAMGAAVSGALSGLFGNLGDVLESDELDELDEYDELDDDDDDDDDDEDEDDEVVDLDGLDGEEPDGRRPGPAAGSV